MRTTTTLFFLCFIAQSVFAQIPNAGFEYWTLGNPDDWNANNVLTNVTQSVSSHSGTYAVRGDVAELAGYTFSPTITSGVNAEGFAFSERPVSITGYFQFSPAASSGDRFAVNVGLYKGGAGGIGVGIAANVYSTATSGYTKFSVPFNYLTQDVPDTCVIMIAIVGPGTNQQALPHVGSYYFLDDLAFSNEPVNVNDRVNTPAQFNLLQNYPNPFNPSTNIQFSLLKGSYIKLHVFNVLGMEVATLVDEYRGAGQYSERFDAGKFASGVYFYRLDAGNYSAMKRMLLVK